MNPRLNELGQPIGPALPGWRPPPFPEPATLDGAFVRLEPLDPTRHGPALFEALQLEAEGRTWTYLPYGPFPDDPARRRWLENFASGKDPQMYAIIDPAPARAVGLAGYLRITPEHGSIEIGHLVFSPRLQRRPAATEALALLIRRAFTLGYRRCEWKCDSHNAASRAAALRLGFSFEGLFRHAIVYKGRSRDTAWFSITDTEWPAVDQAHRRWLDPGNFGPDGRQRVALTDLTRPLLRPRVE